VTDKSVLNNSAVMAAGTVVSRMSGFVRGALLVAALGSALHADVFSIANTVPNMLYILLAGGVFNAVLVPQLVRAMRNDADGGEAYTNRIVTLAGLFLLVVTVLLVVAAPLLMRLYLDGGFYEPCLAEQRESVIDFARYCLPQVFFYGMFVLVGQILNARGRFGPMMWAPIANNVISVAVLAVYLFAFGPASKGDVGGFTRNQELVLGVGSTLGIAAQFLILVPYLKSAGFTFRPRFDFRGSGLGHTLRLGMWTVLFVVVNQIAYTVVVRLASSGTADAVSCSGATGSQGTGYTVYSSTFLLVMVPHSIITVSLATAILPRLSARAHEGDLAGLASTLVATLRTALALIIPFALLLPVVALDVSNLVFGYGAASTTYDNFAPSLALFGAGIAFFTAHYLMLRGFYALERTRTVFWVQCVIAAVNITLAVAFVAATDAEHTSPALVLAYTGAYAVGASGSYLVLRRLLGGLETPRLLRFLVRALLAAGVATAVAAGVAWLVADLLGDDRSKLESLVLVGVVATIDGVLYLLLARALRLGEVNDLVETVTRRVQLRRRT
jgi:putative peptidoglycan lipid II flippase